jgi:hypothetical protein
MHKCLKNHYNNFINVFERENQLQKNKCEQEFQIKKNLQVTAGF